VRDKRHGCERFEGWLGSKHQPRAQCKKPLIKDQGLFNLVAWDGIEPPTQGFSIEILVRNASETKRKSEQNQALGPHSKTVAHCQTQSSAPVPPSTLPNL
jgi:hypothetical protein